MTIRLGDTAEHRFLVDAEAMAMFQRLSGDDSLIHTDPAYARTRGFTDVIVYGGIMLAHLSRVVGTLIPGPRGTSLKWTINYRSPLYVGEEAAIGFEVSGVSAAAGVIEGKFRITCGERLIATGGTQSVVPLSDLQDPGD